MQALETLIPFSNLKLLIFTLFGFSFFTLIIVFCTAWVVGHFTFRESLLKFKMKKLGFIEIFDSQLIYSFDNYLPYFKYAVILKRNFDYNKDTLRYFVFVLNPSGFFQFSYCFSFSYQAGEITNIVEESLIFFKG